MTGKPQRRALPGKKLRKVAGADGYSDHREPPLRVGDIVRLNSGGPAMLVVDVFTKIVVTSWRSKDRVLHEAWFPRPAVHRVRNLW